MNKRILILICLFGCYFLDIIVSYNETNASPTNQYLKSPHKKKSPCNISVGWTLWKPYQYLNTSKELTGLDIEFLQAISKELVCEIDFSRDLWFKNMQKLNRGDIHLLVSASKTPERENFAWFSKAYRSHLVTLHVRSKDRASYGAAELKVLFEQHQFKLGVVKGASYDQQLTQLQEDKKYKDLIVPVIEPHQMIEMLATGEIDGYFEDPLIFHHSTTDGEFSNQFESYPIEIKIGDMYFIFSKKSVDYKFVEQFNRIMEKIMLNSSEKFEWFKLD